MLWLEEQRTGKRVYKRGDELKKGLLDVHNICMDLPINQNQRERDKWRDCLKAMKSDPKLMFEAMPSVWD
jgi:hypothetical protein